MLKSKEIFSISVLFALALQAPVALSQTIIPAREGVTALIGQGYSAEKERFVGRCITPTETASGLQTSTLRLTSSVTENEVGNALGFSASARARYGVVEGKADATYLKSTLSNSFSISLNYYAIYVEKNRVVVMHPLSQEGQVAAGNDDKWKTTCGTEVVDQIQRGGKLFFTIRIDFTSQEQKEAFAASFSISGPMAGAAGSLEQASKSLSRETRVSVTALQQGGDISKLSAMFGKVPGSAFQFVECQFAKLESCKKVLEHAMEYATSQTDGFPAQLKQEGGWAEIGFVLKPWSDYGRYARPALVEAAVKNARDRLALAFEANLKQNELASRLKLLLRLTGRQRIGVEKVAAESAANLQDLAATAQVCFDNEDICVERANTTLTALRVINDGSLDIRPESFAQWCDVARTPGDRRDIEPIVNGVVALAKTALPHRFTPNYEGEYIDECGRAGEWVADQTKLDLTQKGVISLSPISQLSSLNELIADKNAITELKPLGTLAGLRRLQLEHNGIAELSPLGALNQLRYISLAYNAIRDAEQLTSLPNLQFVDLSYNTDGLTCPEPIKAICTSRQLRDYGTFHEITGGAGTILQAMRSQGGAILLGLAKALQMPNRDHDALRCQYSGKQDGKCSFKEECEAYTSATYGPLSVARYSPSSVSWRPIWKATTGEPRVEFGFGAIDGSRAMIAGGWRPNCYEDASLASYFDTGGVFDSELGTYTPARNTLSIARSGIETASLGSGRVLLAGGWFLPDPFSAIEEVAAAEIYDGTKNLFDRTGSLIIGRRGHRMITLPNGQVIVFGGDTANGITDTIEIYDPVSGTFSIAKSRMLSPRAEHAAVMLEDGRIMLIGGLTRDRRGDNVDETVAQTSEIFDPKTLTSVAGPATAEARYGASAILLGDGAILLVGGFGLEAGKHPYGLSDRTPVRGAEIYDGRRSQSFNPVRERPIARGTYNGAAFPVSDSIILLTGGWLRGGQIFVYGPKRSYDRVAIPENP